MRTTQIALSLIGCVILVSCATHHFYLQRIDDYYDSGNVESSIAAGPFDSEKACQDAAKVYQSGSFSTNRVTSFKCVEK